MWVFVMENVMIMFKLDCWIFIVVVVVIIGIGVIV